MSAFVMAQPGPTWARSAGSAVEPETGVVIEASARWQPASVDVGDCERAGLEKIEKLDFYGSKLRAEADG
jgi:hypothetical protein